MAETVQLEAEERRLWRITILLVVLFFAAESKGGDTEYPLPRTWVPAGHTTETVLATPEARVAERETRAVILPKLFFSHRTYVLRSAAGWPVDEEAPARHFALPGG
jgi:hypothetical protein